MGVGSLSKSYTIQILENEIESAEQQAKSIARMAESAFKANTSKDSIAESIQLAIDGSDKKNVFLSVFDWSEKLIAHPDVTLKGSIQGKKSGMKLNMGKTPTGEELYSYINSLEESSDSEIFYLAPIQSSSGWIIGAHLNIENIASLQSDWEGKAYLVFSIVMLMIVLIVMGTIRSITSYYEAQLSLKSSKIEDGVLSISKLNSSLENYQKKLGELASLQTTETTTEAEVTKETEKQRILTYVRNELMPVSTEDIGYIYVENTITYVVQKDGKRSTTGESLDQIYSYLDEKSFFRANRQIIVAISAIDKIIKFGNSKLKIQVTPASEIDIIIGKNKAASFKQWLDL